MNDFSKDLTIEMLQSELYTQIAEAIGVENFYKLAQTVGGETIYIPKQESIVRPIKEARIKAEFNGYNHTELARRYGFSERWVRTLCGDGHPEGQLSIFDCMDETEDGNS